MSKIPECDHCRFYEGNPYIVCANFPSGPQDDFCPHFALDPDTELEELWEPEGARFVNGDLAIARDRSFYNGEEIIQPRQRWTPEEQLARLDSHPMFTGRCPQCELTFPQYEKLPVHWDCPACGWLDDTV
jgi:hypothetical protein